MDEIYKISYYIHPRICARIRAQNRQNCQKKKFFSGTAVLNFEKFLESIVNAVFGEQANTAKRAALFAKIFYKSILYD